MTTHPVIFKLCIMIAHTLKMCTIYFVPISWIFSHFWWVLSIFFHPKCLDGVCFFVICNSNSFHSFIFKLKLHNGMYKHWRCAPHIFCIFDCILLKFWIYDVLNLYNIITSTPPLRCLHCVICNSNSFHSFLFQTLHTYSWHIEGVNLLFCAVSINIFSHFFRCWT